MKITKLHAREILDSRGFPTIETELTLADGSTGKGAVPSGASTGSTEAHELRDNDPTRYRGKGVLEAVENVNTHIANAVVDRTFATIDHLDDALIDLDGTDNKENLGGNAILSVSMAFCKALAKSQDVELYEFFQDLTGTKNTEAPQLSILIMEGGKHGAWATDFQEYMIIPRLESFPTVAESVQAGSEIFWATHDILEEKKYSTTVGFEGAFAPKELRSNTEAFEIILAGIEKAGYTPQDEIFLGIDAAASEFYEDGTYNLKREGKQLSTDDWISLQIEWFNEYPIWSAEDMLDEEDWEGWKKLTSMAGDNLQIVGDDLLTTNTERIQKAIDERAVNSVLIKINQIGTVSETLDAILLADSADFTTIISHRGGETNDDFIADLVMGTSSWQTKFGGPDRGERLAKYNRLLEIEESLNGNRR
jgi:enolase